MARRTRPVSRATDAAVGTGGTAFAVPTTTNITKISIKLSADGYVGMGSASSPPTVADTNTVYHFSGTTVDYFLDGVRQTDGAYVYVYSVAATLDAKLSYFA